MRRIDQATVAGYYGSDSAGTFVTALGVLATAHIAYDAYMPVMLAVMEIPGCLVALFLVARLRNHGMDSLGNMPDEPGYDPERRPLQEHVGEPGHHPETKHEAEVESELEMALEKMEHPDLERTQWAGKKKPGIISGKLLHEVFLNTGLYLLFGGIIIGLISGLQGPEVTRADDSFFVTLFQGVLCLFLLEMGMTASRKLKDLKTAGWRFVVFGLVAPNIFATFGIAGRSCLLLGHRHTLRAGNLCALLRPVRGGFLHRRARGSAAGDPGSKPHAAVGRFARAYLLVQCDDWHPRLHGNRQGGDPRVPVLRLIATLGPDQAF